MRVSPASTAGLIASIKMMIKNIILVDNDLRQINYSLLGPLYAKWMTKQTKLHYFPRFLKCKFTQSFYNEAYKFFTTTIL